MGLLLRHDLKLLLSHKKSIILIAIALPLLMYIFSLVSLTISMGLIAVILVITNESSGKLLNSLPTRRIEIVISRFIFMTIVSLIVIGYLLFIIYFLSNNEINISFQNPNSIISFFSFNIIALAFLMPFGFIFTSKSDVALAVVFIVFNSFSLMIWDVIFKYPLVSMIIAIILLISSFLMSISLFSEREFD